ncbi:GNAT family N-acetyltransferase [Listeria booriae]|uniref:GNAT family N-acetyltransferase n=1 Tax=Listeria booriae TaxID=1552123 RepID=UPI001623890C|nr:GNAT family N-acetyltransferase [Listeria booriae]MBC1523779.1 GNAT family N-acetyltransferase [Listeria booriae]MBC1531461.1 GNAT family N-acetyltransferase [Listeria booriae]MBC6135103.1 GNAT family N-acetyltransferase [Listeria booriae]
METRFIEANQTHDLRHRVLIPDHPVEALVYPGDDDATTFHIGVFDEEEQLVAIGSFYEETDSQFDGKKQYRLRGMASDPGARLQGLGKAVIVFAEEELARREADLLWCNARVIATGFYEKMGFHSVGSEFVIPKIGGHYKMGKVL